ncbi:HEAT repeat domain-containing protein [Mariniblastus fucicola]|uniref:Armadillo/beta-catenin-like repeat protein n=1 Tax=Mariniblastus fucicola TaxID=980251 RepID=A0A5B9PCC0_9BACT|nr:HEAT repeat domain-containing protein [Mariniblastus fucicola]QEG22166.1 Armadillo/beta-catenin-like repeat protein [Mariniblastus fucicola]
MGNAFSYVVGILVAGLIVFGLRFGIQFASPAYARQVQADAVDKMSLDDLEKMLLRGSRSEQLAAITAIGKGDDQLDRRVELIAAATVSTDLSIGSTCKLSIERMGDKAKPSIRKLLESSDPATRRTACGVIRYLGTSGDEFAPDMIKLLKEGDRNERHAAIYAIQDMSAEAIVPALEYVIKELDDPNFNTQCIACLVLRQMGSSAEPAVARLVQLLQEGNVSSRSRAAEALAAIGPVEGYDIPGLVAERLKAFSYMEKVRALDALGDLGPNASTHVEEIGKLMRTPKLNTQAAAALAYFRVTGKSDEPVDLLLSLLKNKSTRLTAIECLGGFGEAAAEAVPALIEFLDDEELANCETAALTLKSIGPPAVAALPKLKKLLQHEDYLITVAAQEAIDAISSDNADQ